MNIPNDPIINIRGPSGSGKTHTVYELLGRYPKEERWELAPPKARAPRAFKVGNLWVLGRYTGAACSGVDGMFPLTEKITPLIEHYGELGGPVLIESLVLSSAVSLWIGVQETFPGRVVLAYLDTPVDRCIENIYKRNGGKPIKEKQVRSHYNTIQNSRARMRAHGFCVVELDHTRAYDHLEEVLRAGGWQT